jgi:hypothetical protein
VALDAHAQPLVIGERGDHPTKSPLGSCSSLNDLARFEETSGATHQVASTFAQVGQPPGTAVRQ